MSCNEIISKNEIEQKFPGHYLTYSEIEQFKIDCPLCCKPIMLLEFSNHLQEDVKKITEEQIK